MKILNLIWLIIIFVISVPLKAQNMQWEAPASSDKIKNPVSLNDKSLAKGKKIFNQYCALCHGNKGKGDGIGGIALDPKPANFTKPIFTKQTDGAIYWKINNGRAPMAAYKGLLSDQEIWEVILYIRSLSK